MSSFITFILNYWYILVAILAVIVVAGIVIYNFVKMPRNEQLSKVWEWLLWAVTEAEHELGSGTGQLKLRLVYDMFIGKFPSIAKILTFQSFSDMVDQALKRMETLIETNQQVAKYVGRTEE